MKVSESKYTDDGNLQKCFRSGPSAFPVSCQWLHEGNQHGAHSLEERAVLCGVRLQEALQGVRVRLTLAVCDVDGDGSEEQEEAGASQVNPYDCIMAETWCVLIACSCRKKGKRGKGKAQLQTSACILKCL